MLKETNYCTMLNKMTKCDLIKILDCLFEIDKLLLSLIAGKKLFHGTIPLNWIKLLQWLVLHEKIKKFKLLVRVSILHIEFHFTNLP